MKTALLAATALITLATSSQAGPSWKEVLKEVVIASAQPQPVYVVRQGYCYSAPRVVYYQPAPRVVYYAQPVHRCYTPPVDNLYNRHRPLW